MDENKEVIGNIDTEEVKSYGLDPKDDFSDDDEVRARIKARKTEQARRRKKARNRAYFFIVFILLLIGLVIFSFTSFFDVDSIEVEGNSYFTAEEVINMAHATPGKNIIYHPDKHNIVSYLEKNPYIKKAKVRRSFPSTIVIEIEERTQVGAVTYSDEYLIIDGDGLLLRKTKTRPKLTEVEGIIVSRIALGEKLGVKDEELLDQTLTLIADMDLGDIYFVGIDMKDMYIKAYIYDQLVCKGTFKQLDEAIRNKRLHKVVARLFEDDIKRGTITFSDEGYASFVPTI